MEGCDGPWEGQLCSLKKIKRDQIVNQSLESGLFRKVVIQ